MTTFPVSPPATRTRGGADARRDDEDGLALWRRVADHLAGAIARGTYPAGTQLPTEAAIAAQFDVNRHTVRRALAALRARGLVRAARGSGTFVESTRLAYPIRPRTRFSENVGASGRQPGGRLIATATEPASAEVARRLGLAAGTPVVRLELSRHADGVVLCVATSWLPAARCPEAGAVYAAKRSMTRTLAHFGIGDYRRAGTRVTAGEADLHDAVHLDLAPGRPVLVVDSVDVDADGTPVVVTRTRFAAERVELVIES
ncbi:phosphonate metabolism transcriptional regulator PhnF [Rhodoplanes sp. SY1]|uniref:phosphonate metabolism transcriptional regulator PhnF n=1 Tax=Rhodoplanes sp. SY1 TaxID=3166646 RepID=UPI0038B4B2F8